MTDIAAVVSMKTDATDATDAADAACATKDSAEAVLMDAQNLSVLGLTRKPLPALPEVAAAVETDDEGDSEDKGEGHAEGLADAETKAGAEAETETATQKIMKEYHARIEAASVKASAAHDEVEIRRASLAHYW